LLHPEFDGIDWVSTCPIGFHQLRMNSHGTFPLKAEMKDHRPLDDVHFLSIHFLNVQNFGQLLAIVSLVLAITVKLHENLNDSCPDA
jgi:hypothetical protein